MSSAPPATVSAELPDAPRTRTAVVNLLFHYAAALLLIIQGFVLVPLYVRYISVATYGAWLAATNVLSWIELADPGLGAVLQQRVAVALGAKDRVGLGKVVGTGIPLSFAISTIPLLCIPLATSLCRLFRVEGSSLDEVAHSFRLGLVGTALMLASYSVAAANLGLHRSVTAGLVFLTSSAAGIGTTLALLVSGSGIASLAWGMVARGGVLLLGNGVALVWWLRRHVHRELRFDVVELHQVGGISAYTFLSRLTGVALSRVDSFLAAAFVSPSLAAVLALTSRAFDPARMLTERVGAAMAPSLSHLVGEGRFDRVGEIETKLLRTLGWVSGVAAGCVVALNGVFVSLWVGPELFGGLGLTAAYACVAIGATVTSNLNQVVFSMGGIRQTALIQGAETLARLPLQIALLKAVGPFGIPTATAAVSIVFTGPSLSIAMARLLGKRPSRELTRVVGSYFVAAAFLLGGALVAWGVSKAGVVWTWPRFLTSAAVVGFAFAGPAMLLSPTLKEIVLRRRLA